jgi:hypothetical protein
VSFRSDYQRFLALSGDDRMLLLETAIALLIAYAGIRWLPFRKVVASCVLGPAGEKQGASYCTGEISRVTWAVSALARRLPIKMVCFQKGLAVHRLLRRRGIRSLLHYGVRQDHEEGLKAHVWVTYAGEPVIGGDEAVYFTCLATFPGSALSAPASG